MSYLLSFISLLRFSQTIALNKPESYLLAMVKEPQDEDALCSVRYVEQPFHKEPDFGSISVNYSWQDLWAKGQELTGWRH